MQEEEEEPSDEYLKGFNQGYILAKQEPTLLEKILKSQASENSNDFIKGLFHGKNQYDLEPQKDNDELRQWEEQMRSGQSNQPNRNQDLDY